MHTLVLLLIWVCFGLCFSWIDQNFNEIIIIINRGNKMKPKKNNKNKVKKFSKKDTKTINQDMKVLNKFFSNFYPIDKE